MAEQKNPREQTAITRQSQHPPSKCQVDIIFLGKDNSGLEAAKQILIASFVKNMTTKGNINDFG